jgi:hypothetical protein
LKKISMFALIALTSVAPAFASRPLPKPFGPPRPRPCFANEPRCHVSMAEPSTISMLSVGMVIVIGGVFFFGRRREVKA